MLSCTRLSASSRARQVGLARVSGAAMVRATTITGTLGPPEFVQIRGVCTELKELRWQRSPMTQEPHSKSRCPIGGEQRWTPGRRARLRERRGEE
eukprot:6214328-Pleurochrysis_carterae.AAC.2